MNNETIVIVAGVVATVVAQIVTLLTLMVNARTARLRREEQHAWDVAERVQLAEKVMTTSKILASKVSETSALLAAEVVRTRADLADKVQATTDKITQQIADNTVKTVEGTTAAIESYREANHVNVKISDLNARLLAQGKFPS